MHDWINFAMGDEWLRRLMGYKMVDFSIFAALLMDKVWALQTE